MARNPKPWWRKERNAWFVTINGTRHNLGADKKEAKDRFHELMANKAVIAPSDTVWAVLDAFLEWTEKHRPASYEWYRAALQRFKDGVPNCRIVDLNAATVETWLGSHDEWGPTYKAGMVTAIRRAFNWANKKAGLTVNPVRGLDKPTPESRNRVLSAEEYAAILKLVKDQSFKDVLLIAWKTGARPQELTRIEKRHIQKNKTVVFPKKEAKGKKRARVIFLDDECYAILARQAVKYPEGPLLRNTRGEPWTAMSIGCRFGRMKDTLGYRPVLYWFRHSYIHHGLTKGKIDPVTMATLAGHADLTMIYKVYGHLLKDSDHMREAAIRASASMPKASTADASTEASA
ncbi:MAG TPA: site-specific integrase [Pirellulaceae bacterium]|jgi:integrase